MVVSDSLAKGSASIKKSVFMTYKALKRSTVKVNEGFYFHTLTKSLWKFDEAIAAARLSIH